MPLAIRFTAALLLDTPYVAVVDDDVLLGRRFLSYCLKLLHTQVRHVIAVCCECAGA